MGAVSRAVRYKALDRSEVPEQLRRELDSRLRLPDKRPLPADTGKSVLLGVLSVVSGLAWAGLLVWVLITAGLPRRFGGNLALVAVLVVGGIEVVWTERKWRNHRDEMKTLLRQDGLAALSELLR